MATHYVTIETPPLEVRRADINILVRKGSQKLGDLRISKGAAVWFPNGNSYGHKLSWSELANLFTQNGKRSEIR